MSEPEQLLHGRLVARLKRQVGKVDRNGPTPIRHRKILHTLHSLILLERRMNDPSDLDRVVTPEQMRARVDLMKPGAGLEVPR
jgi:hypothetical protein